MVDDLLFDKDYVGQGSKLFIMGKRIISGDTLTLCTYIERTHLIVRSDRHPRLWIMDIEYLTAGLMCSRLRFSPLDFEIAHRPGRNSQMLDAVSRLIRPPEPP